MAGLGYWKIWDYRRPMPVKTQEQFEEYVRKKKELILGKDQDWFEGIIGYEGSGKSQYGLRKCQLWDPTFIDNMNERIVYNVDDLEKLFDAEVHGISILVDEAVYLAHARSGFKQHVVRFVEDIIGCRYLNDYIGLCIPKITSLDTYLRNERLRTITWCKDQGKIWIYGKRNGRRIYDWDNRHRLPVNKRPRISPRADFRYYPPALTEKDEIWKKYLRVKSKRNKERYRRKNKGITTLTSGDIAKKYGVTEQTGRNYLKKIYAACPEAVVVVPTTGQLRLRKEYLDDLEAIFAKE